MILDGKKIASDIYEGLQKKIQKSQKKPTLWAILVGDNAGSLRYIAQKKKFCEKIGMKFSLFQLPENIQESELLEQLTWLNNNPEISGYIVQLPLPDHIDSNTVISHISPKKDMDGFHPINQGKVVIGDDTWFVPCTPAGIMKIFEYYHISLSGKNVCIIGRSNIVGKPISLLCINAGATVISCNSKSKNISQHTLWADIIILAAGKPWLLTPEMVQKESIIIDVWFSIIDGEIYGDAMTRELIKNGNTITPVPGWVGPMTVAMLLYNTLSAHEWISQK